MSSALYNREILRLAASLVAGDKVMDADATAEARSPLCGSRISVDVNLGNDGKVTAFALRANACALGQASSAILHRNIMGHGADIISEIRDDIAAALGGDGDMPQIWPELELLAVARDFKARHAAILLPYDATILAISRIKIGAS